MRDADMVFKHIFLGAGLCATLLCTSDSALAKPRKGSSSASRVKVQAEKAGKSKPVAPAPRRESISLAAWNSGRAVPAALAEPVELEIDPSGSPRLQRLPRFSQELAGQMAALTRGRDYIFFTVDPELQRFAEKVVSSARTPHIAVVMMEPATGKVLAIASRSSTISDLALHSKFPAASLFKLVTAAGAIERHDLNSSDRIFFRGGNYTLSKWNYLPDEKRDRRWMTAAEALGKSCNPAFGRIALKYLSTPTLQMTAQNFGFNSPLAFDVALRTSRAFIPDDSLGLSLAGAGFGDVTISPVHAAAMVAGLARGGILPKPYLIDRIISSSGSVAYRGQTRDLKRMMSSAGADRLLKMMESTTTIGTSRSAFMRKNRPLIPGVRVAAKTGTLSGSDPKGVNNWFVAAAPIEQPSIALAVVVVNPSGTSSKASQVGKVLLERYIQLQREPGVTARARAVF